MPSKPALAGFQPARKPEPLLKQHALLTVVLMPTPHTYEAGGPGLAD